MDVRFKQRYATETEALQDLAKSSRLYRQEDFEAFAANKEADTYANLIIATKDKHSKSFSDTDYDLLAGEDRASYLYNEFLQDRNETAIDEETGEKYNVYERNKEYLNYRIEEAIDAKTFDSLSNFEKVIHTIGGTIGNALNELFLGTTEGLMDVLAGLSVISPTGFIPGYADAVKDFIKRDITGVQSNREALQRYARAYTYIDKNAIAKVVNDVTTGLTKMAPLLIPGAGQGIYFGSMAGSTAEEAIRANPNIDYGTLLLYTGAVTGLEFATEKISSKFFGGSAIDNLMFKASGNRVGSWIGKIGIDFLSEGFEEAIAEIGNSILYTVMVDNNAPLATVSDILYAGLIGGLIGGVTAGGQIATTAKLVILEDGTVVSAKEAGDKGTKLSRTQSFRLNTAIEYASQLATKDAIQDLQVKYSNETLDDIKRNHSEEYAEAEEANNDRDKRLAEATLGLAKVYEMAGAQGFQRAAELVNYTLNQKAELAKNYVTKSKSNNPAIRLVENEYARKHEGSSITIRESLTEREQQLSKAVRNAFGVNVYFGNLGSEDGNIRNNGLTLNENTIILDDKLFNYKSVDEILTAIVREELIHSLQFDSGVLTGKSLTELQMICSKLGIEGLDFKITLDEAYAKDSPLTKIAESQAKSLAQVLLFDEITVGKVFLQNKNIFKRTYDWLKGLRRNIENRKTKKDQKTKVEYNTVLTALQMYRKAAASKIGNKEDAELMNKEIFGNDANLDDLLNMMNVNYDTEHYSMVKINFGNTSTKVLEVNNLIRENSKQSWSFMINYEQALNSDFYNPEFVQKIQSRNPKRSFDYNLQDMLISDYGMCINSKDKCLMKVVDLTAATSEDFMMDLEDLYVNITSLEKYTSLSDIFSTKFKTQTLNSLGVNGLDSVKINIEYVDFKQSTPAQYIGGENKVITLKLPTKQELTPQEVNTIKHDLLHEVHHALADIQGLQTGTTAKTIRKALVNASPAEIDKLAKILLVDSFYQENKNNPNIILDYLSYGIYRITDGEYGAEAYEDSYVRGKEDKLKLKAGTTLNRTGFRKYTGYLGGMRATYFEGYGRFNGITLIPLGEESNIDTKLQSSNLLDASEVVAYNKEVTRLDSFGNYLNKLGDRTTLIELGFNEEFIDSVSDIDASYSTITDAFNHNKIGNDNATNLVMKWLMEHKHGNVKNEADNKYIKTIQDINKVRNYGLIYAQIYKAYMTKNNPEFSRTEPHTFEELQKFATEGENPLIFKSESISNSITRLVEKPVNADNFNMAIMNMDYDYSADKTGRLIGYMAKPKGLGNFIEESESFSHTKGTQSKEFSKLDIAAKGNVIDEAEKTTEDEYEDKESTQQAAEEDISETLEEKAIKKQEKITVKDVIKQTEDRVNSLYDSVEYFTLATRINKKTDVIYKTIKDAFSEKEVDVIHKELKSLVKTKSAFVDQVKLRISKIQKNPELAKKHKDLLNRDYSNYTPKQFDDYIAKLDKVLEKVSKTKVKETSKKVEETSIWDVDKEELAKKVQEREEMARKEDEEIAKERAEHEAEIAKQKEAARRPGEILEGDMVVVTKGKKVPLGTEIKVLETYDYGYKYADRVTVGHVPYIRGTTPDGAEINIQASNVSRKDLLKEDELKALQKQQEESTKKTIYDVEPGDKVIVTKGQTLPIGTEITVDEKYYFNVKAEHSHSGDAVKILYIKGKDSSGKEVKIQLKNVKLKESSKEKKPEVKPIEEKKPTADLRPSAIVAPYFSNPILNAKDYKKSQDAVDKKFKDAANSLSKSLGIELVETHDNLGSYTFDETGKTVQELSYTFFFKEGTDFNKIKLFSSLLGDIGHETQETVVASRPVDENDIRKNNVAKFTIKVKEIKGLTGVLKELGINDYTIDISNKSVSVLIFDDIGNVSKNMEQYQSLITKLGDNVDGKQYEILESELIYPRDRRVLYQEWLRDTTKSKKQSTDGDNSIENLRGTIQEAQQALDEKYPVETKEEKPVETKKEEISVPPEAAHIKIAIDNAETLMKDDSADSIANCILNAFSAAKHGESEAQFFEGTDLDYEKLSFNLIEDHLSLFSTINDDNYSDIRNILAKDTSENGKLSLLMFDWYCLKMEGKFSPETRALIFKTNRVELTKAAQRMAAQAKRVMEKKGVTTMISSFKENGINTQVTDEILAKAFPELANKNKRIAELEKQIKELDEKIKTLKDDNAAITEAFTQQKKLAEEKVILAKGTNEDIADYKLNQIEESGVEGIENASKKAKQMLQEMIDIATVADESGKQVGFYVIDEKTGEPKPFPKVQEKILKVAKAMKGFRMWAMLSSPVTYVRNWGGNVGMKGLEKASAALSRRFEKEITDEQYNTLESKKTESKKKLKDLSKEATPLKTELVTKEAVLENTDKDSDDYKKLESEINEINKKLSPVQEKIDAAEKEIRGYEFQQHQYNIHKVKATQETKNYVKDKFGTTIDNLISGNKYSVDKDTLTQKAISTKEASLKIKAKKGTFKEKVISWAQLYEMKGLETGWTGDRNFIRTSLINNFSDILESNKNLFLREIKTESEKLHKIKKPSENQIARMELLDKALTTQKMEDIVATRDVTEINMLLDKADTLSKKQYFKNSNVLSEWMYNLGKKHPVAATLVSFVMPFPKVAYNILTTAIEYSPLAWFKALTKKSVISQMEKGEYLKSTGFEKADYASIKAKATVGTVMFIAGTIATLLGFIDIDEDDYLGAALTFNFGDSQFKIGLANMAPSLTTFSTAAAVMWAFKEHQGLKGAINQALSTLYDNTLLGNVENIFRYGSLENWASNTSISWMSQYVPAVLKLITKVTSGGVKKDKSGSYLQKVSRTLASYIPGLNTLVPNKIDPYTGKLTYTSGSDSWLFNFIAGVSPLDIKLNNLTGLEAEAKSVNAITTGFSGNITINGKDITISNKESYAKYRAEYINTHAKDIISGKEKVTVEDDNGNRITTTYGNLNDKQKANVLNRVYSDATSKTKIKYWLDEGNYYYTSNKDEYNELRKLFKNDKIIYRSSWKTSKFVKG